MKSFKKTGGFFILKINTIYLFFIFIYGCSQSEIKKIDATPPEWAKGIVWYQIFPERFCNGDSTNDPKLEDQKGCWPHELNKPWKIHPWTSDWYTLQDYEKENHNDIWYNITRRRYGGDLQGIINKLDYMKELGIGAIYLNPVFISPSHHKYDIAYYHHIDPTFGPNPKGDWEIIENETPDDPSTWKWTSADSLMLKLIDEVHKRNIKIILDGVFNHCGYNFFAFQNLKEKQQNSKFKDWFSIYSWDTDRSNFNYEGWWGVKDMPEFREDSSGLVSGPRNYIFNITKRWMDPGSTGDFSKGIDGWRLDVADQVGHTFWKDWHKLVKSINPSAFITGEVTGPIAHIQPYLQGDEFGSVMNYNFSFITSEYFIHPDSFSTKQFDSALQNLREAFPEGFALAMQNLLGSHDTDRPLSRIHNSQLPSYLNQSNFFDKTSARNKNYLSEKPNEEAYQIFKLMVFFQMTYPGAPMIYYGDELGMWGAKDPGCRKPMIWKNLLFENECSYPDGSKLEPCNKVVADTSLLHYYIKLLNVRNQSKALSKGDFKSLLTKDNEKIFAFKRTCQEDSVIIVINNSKNKQKTMLPINTNCNFEIIFNNNSSLEKTNKGLFVQIPALSGVIIKIKKN